MAYALRPGPGPTVHKSALQVGLVAYWDLDESSGTRYDSHINGLDLTDNNTVGNSASGGPDGGSVADFEKDNDEYLSHADDALFDLQNSDWTLAAWIKYESHTTWGGILGKWEYTTNEREFLITMPTTANKVSVLSSWDGTNYTQKDHSSTLSSGTWYFVVGTHDDSADEIGISLDGGALETASTTAGGPYQGTAPLTVGTFGTLEFDGLIAYAGIWNRLLTAAEITWLYNSGSGRDYDAIVAYTGS